MSATKSTQSTFSLFTPSATALLRAIGTPADLEGAAQGLPIIVSCVQAAASLWPNGPLKQWAEVTVEMQRHFSAGKSMVNGVPRSLFNQPLRPTKTYEQFTNWRSPPLSIGPAFEAHALLGRAVVQAASAGRVISGELMSGLQTLARARHRDSRNGRSADWDRIIAMHLRASEELKQALANISPKSPIAGFIAAAISVLDTVCQGPSSIDNHSHSGTEGSLEGQSKENRVPTKTISNDQVNADQTDGDGEGQDGTPDIKTRLRAADYTSFTEKLGLYHRDQMLIGDLVDIIKQLVKFLSNGSLKEKGFALLAVLSLVTGCSDVTALQLQFGPLHSIWLDLNRGCWAWDFNVYRRSKGDLIEESIVQPIFIPWPSLIDGLLNLAYKNNPAAKTLADLILTIQKMDHFDLKGYRQFLRNCGHPSHPPYRGRIAHSTALVYLEVTGSDMTAAMMTGSPACAGPAALYYFGLTQQVLQSRITQVYETLGLGPPSARNNDSGRVGCHKVLEIEVLRKGWSDLTTKINEARDQARGACDPENIRNRCNQWMSLLCTAFVIQSAHRATRLECLTAGALYLHNDVALIHDKDEGDRVQPRLVPKTASLQKILQSAAECHQLMRTLSGAARNDEPVFWELNETIFCQWKKSGNGFTQEILKTGDVEAHTRHFFSQSEANFGRSNWVTYLDNDQCNRWLIRSLTGHTRDVTRTHGPYFDVPPLVVASRLGLQMEVTGQRIFGETDISLGANAPPILKLIVSKCQSAGIPDIDRVPDPRTILQPLSIDTLIKWCVSDQIRKDLISGHIDAQSDVLAVLHLLFIDQIPFADLCISAVVDREKFVKQYGQRAGLSWLRSHFIHPTWLPIQPTTYRLLQRINASAVVSKELIMQVCTTIRKRQYCGWPTSENACWSAIASMGLSFRRLSFPPSIAAVSDLAVPAPCLSAVSLSRLMGEQGNAAHATRAVKPPARARRTEEDAKFLIRTLGKFASTTDRLGEKIKRPKLCLHELESSQIAWSPFVKWVKDWVVDELTRTRQSQPHCYLISSIETYTSTLLTALTHVSLIDDPLDWEDHEWMAWVEQTNKACGGKPSDDDDEKEDVLLTERARHAIQALVKSLVRRQIAYFSPSWTVFQAQRGRDFSVIVDGISD